MAVAGSVTITGLDELQERMKDLSAGAQRRVLRRGLVKAANVVRQEARKRAPVRTGRLKRGVRTKVTVRRDGLAVAQIYPGRSARHGLFAERGTQPHVIRPRTAKVLADGRTVYGRTVQHPGQPARPWMKPAAEAAHGAANEAFRVAAGAEIEAILRRQAAGIS